MKTRLLIFSLAAALSIAWSQQPAQRAANDVRPVVLPEDLASRYTALREIEVPKPAEITLSNGIKVYLLKDHTLPVVSGSALIRTGNLFDPPEKIGLAGITGAVLRLGGTQSRTGEEIDQELENMAASVETGIGETSGSASFWTLKENLNRVLAIYADVLMHPAFRQDKLDLVKQQTRSSIARRNDDPHGIAAREFNNATYGKDSPYGWQIEYEHINRIERADLEAFYERYFFPANISLSIYGDFSSETIKSQLEEVFKEWTVKQPPPPEFPAVQHNEISEIFLVDKQDVNQSNILFGHLGGVLRDKDYPALEVMSTILGGGFQSRLFQEVRSRQGLAYGASANWGASYNHPGVFSVSIGTKSESTVKAIRAASAEIARIRSAEVSDEELATAKDSVLNSFVFNFDTRQKTLNRLMAYQYWDYPRDFIFQYRDGIRGVTKADVLRVAKEHLHPEQFKLVVVGKASDFDEPLDVLNRPVTKLDITIPEPAVELSAADAESLARGKAVLERAQAAAGGAEVIASIKDISAKLTMKPEGRDMTISQNLKVVLPDVMRQETRMPFGQLTIYAGPEGGWGKTPQGQIALPEPQMRQAQGELFRFRPVLLLSDRDPDRTVNFVEESEVNGAPAEVIEIAGKQGQSVRLWIGKTTGDLLKTAYQGAALSGPATDVEEIYSDFRETGGYRTPFMIHVRQNGKDFAEVVFEEMEFNAGLTKEALAQP